MWDYLFGLGGGNNLGSGFSGGTVLNSAGMPTGENLWGQSLMGDMGNLFGSTQGNKALATGMLGANMYNQNQYTQDAMDMQQQQNALATDAYLTDKENAEKTQKLNF